ncbi:MAG: efflux RND transporter permease subunit, partial [Duodenibacillus sp.]|nr:efflux RND transporter permease subunit [Duodenibacillus sp.]
VQDIDGVKEVTSVSVEGSSRVTVEGMEDVDPNQFLQDIKTAVDRITTFPSEAKKPVYNLQSPRTLVVEAVLTGSNDLSVLRHWAENVKDALRQRPEITQADLTGIRDHEIHVQISQDTLRRYGLTMNSVASAIAAEALEQGGGSIKTTSGDIMLKMDERKNWALDFEAITVVAKTDGARLRLSDIAQVVDTFDESRVWSSWNGGPSVLINVYRIGDQTPEGVAKAAHEVIAEMNQTMPPELHLDIVHDMAVQYNARQDLLLKNAWQGMLLVFVCLSLFLKPSLAFWVSLGVPVSVLGAFIFFPYVNQTINMMSMFAFIVTLGIVVDDAIVVGENIATHQEAGMPRIDASVIGVQQVATPVVFSVLTNMVSFVPMLYVPGFMGKIWASLPWVVILVFACSLFESLFILPAHLAHGGGGKRGTGLISRALGAIEDRQQAISRSMIDFSNGAFRRFEVACVKRRYGVVATGVAVMVALGTYAASGWLGFDLMPRVEQDRAFVTATIPSGSSSEVTSGVAEALMASARKTAAELEPAEGRNICSGIFLRVSDTEIRVGAYIGEGGTRKTTTSAFTERWRRNTPRLPDATSLLFQSDSGGPGAGKGLTVRLSHRDKATLDQASDALVAKLEQYSALSDIDSGLDRTKRQFDLKMTPLGQQLGLNAIAD